MRRPGKRKNIFGWLAITVGLIILLSLILPVVVWWFLLGACLIAGGLYLNRCC